LKAHRRTHSIKAELYERQLHRDLKFSSACSRFLGRQARSEVKKVLPGEIRRTDEVSPATAFAAPSCKTISVALMLVVHNEKLK
jgi:hypothetical protein